jgi:hypothetical protein
MSKDHRTASNVSIEETELPRMTYITRHHESQKREREVSMQKQEKNAVERPVKEWEEEKSRTYDQTHLALLASLETLLLCFIQDEIQENVETA